MLCPQCRTANPQQAEWCVQCGAPLQQEGGAPPFAAPPVAPYATPASAGVVPKEHRTWGMLAHVTVFSGFVIPFGSIIGPLVIWLMKKDEMPFVADQGKEVLNFQISVMIYLLVSAALVFVLIGLLLVPAVVIFSIVMTIIGAMKANEGEYYRYPLCIRLIQ